MKSLLILLLFIVIILFGVFSCTEEAFFTDSQGDFTVLTYNVAGLPEGISGSNPVENIPLISPLLNEYDLVIVQEDFYYHQELIKEVNHPYQSEPLENQESLGDGLNLFSEYPFYDLCREQWQDCYGILDGASDCLTPKGFFMAKVLLSPGLEFHLYNLHMEAGNGPQDHEARVSNVNQLLNHINQFSNDKAIILGGDFNLHNDSTDEILVQQILSQGNLTDACRYLDCGDEGRIDRIMFRSNNNIQFEVDNWRIPEDFTDQDGDDLSDHEPVATDFTWSRLP